MSLYKGGRTVYGQALGVLMLDTVFPRIPGDVGNAHTWPFPVQYKIVKGATAPRVTAPDPDPGLLAPFVEAARELEADGVRAITTSCGFLAVFQRELAAAVSVPVLASSLLQVPLAARLIRPDQRVGILTVRPNLTPRHFAGAGWSADEIPVHVLAMPDDALFLRVFLDGAAEADPDPIEDELVALVRTFVRDHPDVGAIVCECTNLVPFGQAIRRATGLPVYDLYTLVTQTHAATVGTDFPR